MNIQEALEGMAKHSVEYPDHGHNCACKDFWTSQAKVHIRENPGLLAELALLNSYAQRDWNLRVTVSERLTQQAKNRLSAVQESMDLGTLG
jgi:hypothetical protein